jgi:hypothetical protein
VGVEVVVEAVGEGVHEFAEPEGAGGVAGREGGGVEIEAGAEVVVEAGFAVGFGGAAEGGEVVGFDAGEVVFGLGVEGAEDGVGVGFAGDVGDAPAVAGDGDLPGLALPAGEFAGVGRGFEESGEKKTEENAGQGHRCFDLSSCLRGGGIRQI